MSRSSEARDRIMDVTGGGHEAERVTEEFECMGSVAVLPWPWQKCGRPGNPEL